MTFPPRGTPMNVFRLHATSHLAFVSAILISPALLFPARVCPGQADPRSGKMSYVVSVQELKMAGKSHVAFDKGSQLLAKGDALGSIAYLEQAVTQFPEHYRPYYD